LIDLCPDEELANELGVHDNFSIALNSSIDKVLKDLVDSGKYELFNTLGEKTKTVYELNYSKGTVNLRLFPYLMGLLSNCGNPFEPTEELTEHLTRQNKEYNMHIILYRYQNKRMVNVCTERAIAIVIKDFVGYFKENSISFCFPNTNTMRYNQDLSRVVYYP
jgi:hypothetical protein